MWHDNETERDFLNFSGVADTVAEIVVQARGRPISIGVSGSWGIGKSSMIKLIRASVAGRARKGGDREFVFVEFNAWLYQGYDDARAALMDVIASKLETEAHARNKGIDKAKALLKRVNWLRAAMLRLFTEVTAPRFEPIFVASQPSIGR
jgi:predicted KAP-like P-loop ATPase